MKTISQRELRNDSGQVMREVADGASFRVTSRGRPIAALVPLSGGVDPLTLREGTQLMEFPMGVRADLSTDDVLAELRGGR